MAGREWVEVTDGEQFEEAGAVLAQVENAAIGADQATQEEILNLTNGEVKIYTAEE